MSAVFGIADQLLSGTARLDPNFATNMGLPLADTGVMTDYSPDGFAERNQFYRGILAALMSTMPESEPDRIAQGVIREHLELAVDKFEAGEHFLALNVHMGPFAGTRQVFDQMPRQTEGDWENIARRLRSVPGCLGSLEQTVEASLGRTVQPAPRQLADLARQGEVWTGGAPGTTPYFATLVDAFDASGIVNQALRADLEAAAAAASGAFASTAAYFRDAASRSSGEDGCGPDRYSLSLRSSLGARLDAREAYDWGWEEVHRIEAELATTCGRVLPGANMKEVASHLDHDHEGGFADAESYRVWLEGLLQEALRDLRGRHFDIDDRLMRIECVIPPPGGGMAAYYFPPSEDFGRPGRAFWPVGSKTWFPRWRDVTTAYHEGVPGHHLQIGAVRLATSTLSRFQRFGLWCHGLGEGWALYAERLMAELGYLDQPEYLLGMLNAQLFRAARVVIDVGLHLGLPVPTNESFHPGEIWTPHLALEFGVDRCLQPREVMQSEVVRYLAQPAQATCYKIGERCWLEAREKVKKRLGEAFDLKEFHTGALALGPMGLDQLKAEVDRLMFPAA